MQDNTHFPKFEGWAGGYAALTYGYADKDKVIEYIKNQQEHHKTISFEEEYRKLLKEHNVEIDDRNFP